MFRGVDSATALQLTVLFPNQEVTGSKLEPQTAYSEQVFSWYFSVLLGRLCTVLLIGHTIVYSYLTLILELRGIGHV